MRGGCPIELFLLAGGAPSLQSQSCASCRLSASGKRSACYNQIWLREPYVFPRIHLEIEHQRILRIRLNQFLHEFHVDRVFAEDRIFVHRLEIDGDEEWPVDFLVDSLAAFDAEYLLDFEELHPRVHH